MSTTEATAQETPAESAEPETPAGMICKRCKRKMRRRGVKAADAPNTIAYAYGGECNSCTSPKAKAKEAAEVTGEPEEEPDEPKVPKAEDPVRMGETVSALESWMSWRRGSNREKKNPIKYKPEPLTERIAA